MCEKMSRNTYWNKILGLIPITILLSALALYFFNSIIYYLGAGRDDTFISLWAGSSLAEGYGLVNYNFESMEMSSSLLHSLIIAVTHILAPTFIYTINKALGLITGACLLVLLYKKRNTLFENNFSGTLPFAITIVGLANNRAWLYWNLGGLETPFQTLIIFLYGLYLIEFWKTPVKVLPLVVIQILYLLVRPEGFIIILFTSFFLFARSIKFRQPLHRKQFFTLIGIPSSIFLAILVARYQYFGLFFPTPVYAKINLGLDNDTISKINAGIKYLIGYYTSSPYVVIQLLILVALVFHFTRILINQKVKPISNPSTNNFNLILWFGLILFNHLFVLGTGGDWMEFYRFIVPIAPILTILTTCFAFRTVNSLIDKRTLSKPYIKISANLALGVLFFIAIATNSSQRDNYETQEFHNCSEKIDLSIIQSLAMDYSNLDENLILMNCAGKRDWDGVMRFITDELPKVYESLNHNITIATFQMGFFPYFIKNTNPTMNIEFIDTLGLTDSNIARMKIPKKSFGVSDGTHIVKIFTGKSDKLSEYILNRNPNMIYVLVASDKRRQELSKLGWIAIWDQPGAVIFIKNSYNDRVTLP